MGAQRTVFGWPPERSYRHPRMELRGRTFAWGTGSYLMGIINVTPDSFSGDGTAMDVAAAVERARAMDAAGADILDIGAASSRPGFEPLPVDEELARLLPSLEAVRGATALPISVDTYRPDVARAAFAAGADAVNDIHGLSSGQGLARVAAEGGGAVFAMYNHRDKQTRDVAGDIHAGFETAIATAADAGLPLERLVLDPGFGFGWTPEENLEMLRRLPELWDLEMPLLVGTSRKSTIGYVIDAPVEERLEGTAATVALAIGGGADMLRVHDVAEMRRVAKVSDAVVRDNWRQA